MRASFSSAAAVLAATVAAMVVVALASLPMATAELTSAFRSDFDEVVSSVVSRALPCHVFSRTRSVMIYVLKPVHTHV